MHREISFWFMIIAMMLTALAAANAFAGTYFGIAAIMMILMTRWLTKSGW